MPLLRPLFEAWLMDAAKGPLAPWKRRWLKRALRRDEALRCLAAELAEFSYLAQAPAAVQAPDLRPRLRTLASQLEADRPLFPNAWVPAGAIAFLLLLALVAVLQRPSVAPLDEQQARARRDADAATLALPSPTLTASPTPAAGAVPAHPTLTAPMVSPVAGP